jgi:hypothetical protein
MWTLSEKQFLKKLNNSQKIQCYLDDMVYNIHDAAISPRYVMLTNDGHCLEGGLLAAAALEFHGHQPLMISLQAERDDHHVITVYKTKTGWGSLSKSNTTLLRGRDPIFRNIRELVMSYFEFYFNVKGQKSLYAYSNPINLNNYNHWNWRTTDDDLHKMGQSFSNETHYELLSIRELKKLPKVPKKIQDAWFLGANPDGFY